MAIRINRRRGGPKIKVTNIIVAQARPNAKKPVAKKPVVKKPAQPKRKNENFSSHKAVQKGG